MDKIFDIENLSFSYNGKTVLKDVSLQVEKGDYIGIIGPNGSGKSTLVKLMLGILKPAGGKIRLFGEDIREFRNWNRIGYVSQKATAFNTGFPATVEEIVGASLYPKNRLFGRPEPELKERVYRALETVGMSGQGKTLIGNLSGGQQQRVFIARMLAGRPDVMILDEPTSGIDASSEEAVYCLLARVNKEMGITVIMISHDISAVTVHANKLVCMGNGSTIVRDPRDGLTEEVLSELYGHSVNIHVHRHECDSCFRKEVM